MLAPTLVLYIYNLVKIVFSLKNYLVKIVSQQEISDLHGQVQVQFLELEIPVTRRFGQAPKKRTPPAVCIQYACELCCCSYMPPDTSGTQGKNTSIFAYYTYLRKAYDWHTVLRASALEKLAGKHGTSKGGDNMMAVKVRDAFPSLSSREARGAIRAYSIVSTTLNIT